MLTNFLWINATDERCYLQYSASLISLFLSLFNFIPTSKSRRGIYPAECVSKILFAAMQIMLDCTLFRKHFIRKLSECLFAPLAWHTVWFNKIAKVNYIKKETEKEERKRKRDILLVILIIDNMIYRKISSIYTMDDYLLLLNSI